jgi:cation diffusion facilitator family transporter
MPATKEGAAKLLLVTVIGLFILKVAVGVITGSISIWAQAIDSSLDIFAVVITFVTVGYSAKPADREHPFGHGKVEDIAAGIQAILLLTASVGIIYSAVLRIIVGELVQLTEAGIGVMLVSVIVNIVLARYLFRVACDTDSSALEANASNITADIYSTAGVLVGLVVIRIGSLFGYQLDIIDPIIALIVSVLILRATYRVGKMAFSGLIDIRLPRSEEELIISCIKDHTTQLAGFHKVRSRKSGSNRFIDLHLLLPKNISLEEAHDMSDHLEEDIGNLLPNSNVTIHLEPCSGECEQCQVSSCNIRIDMKLSDKNSNL